MKISARNVLKGTVKSVTEGVNDEVVIKAPGGQEIVSYHHQKLGRQLGPHPGQGGVCGGESVECDGDGGLT
ncbi:MAG: hypothetical protein R3A10_19175 [Caldilineaceae bacterium]